MLCELRLIAFTEKSIGLVINDGIGWNEMTVKLENHYMKIESTFKNVILLLLLLLGEHMIYQFNFILNHM